jgi:hypothetical protein
MPGGTQRRPAVPNRLDNATPSSVVMSQVVIKK